MGVLFLNSIMKEFQIYNFLLLNLLNPNKAHGHDKISIKMIQLCGESITPPLSTIFESEIKSGHFPDCS